MRPVATGAKLQILPPGFEAASPPAAGRNVIEFCPPQYTARELVDTLQFLLKGTISVSGWSAQKKKCDGETRCLVNVVEGVVDVVRQLPSIDPLIPLLERANDFSGVRVSVRDISHSPRPDANLTESPEKRQARLNGVAWRLMEAAPEVDLWVSRVGEAIGAAISERLGSDSPPDLTAKQVLFGLVSAAVLVDRGWNSVLPYFLDDAKGPEAPGVVTVSGQLVTTCHQVLASVCGAVLNHLGSKLFAEPTLNAFRRQFFEYIGFNPKLYAFPVAQTKETVRAIAGVIVDSRLESTAAISPLIFQDHGLFAAQWRDVQAHLPPANRGELPWLAYGRIAVVSMRGDDTQSVCVIDNGLRQMNVTIYGARQTGPEKVAAEMCHLSGARVTYHSWSHFLGTSQCPRQELDRGAMLEAVSRFEGAVAEAMDMVPAVKENLWQLPEIGIVLRDGEYEVYVPADVCKTLLPTFDGAISDDPVVIHHLCTRLKVASTEWIKLEFSDSAHEVDGRAGACELPSKPVSFWQACRRFGFPTFRKFAAFMERHFDVEVTDEGVGSHGRLSLKPPNHDCFITTWEDLRSNTGLLHLGWVNDACEVLLVPKSRLAAEVVKRGGWT